MINNKPKGICLNKNAANIQPTQLATSGLDIKRRIEDIPKNLAASLKSIDDENDDGELKKGMVFDMKKNFIELKKRIIIDLPNKANSENQYAEQPPPQLTHDKQQVQQPQQESGLSRIPRIKLQLLASANTAAAVSNKLVKPSSVPQELTKVELKGEIEDIDKSPGRDAIFQVSDLAKDIYQYMYNLEEQQSVKEDYLRESKILTPRVRQRLVNWCIEINSQLKLLTETLYITIALMDRFFDAVQIKQQSQVELVAVGATLIASKYEEIYPPEIADLQHLTHSNYSRREIMRMEICILEKLDFKLGKPIPLSFLRRFSKAANCDLKMHSIAKYLMELSLTEYECAHWRPSLLAAAALFTTIHLVRRDNPSSDFKNRKTLVRPSQDRWTGTLVHYTHYNRQQLLEPAGILCKILKRAQKNPQSYACVRKNLLNLSKWPELKSTRVDDLIKYADQI